MLINIWKKPTTHICQGDLLCRWSVTSNRGSRESPRLPSAAVGIPLVLTRYMLSVDGSVAMERAAEDIYWFLSSSLWELWIPNHVSIRFWLVGYQTRNFQDHFFPTEILCNSFWLSNISNKWHNSKDRGPMSGVQSLHLQEWHYKEDCLSCGHRRMIPLSISWEKNFEKSI